MPATYEPIATTTLSSAASSITFSSIPATYTDLRLVLVPAAGSNGIMTFRFNSDSSSLYSHTYLRGNGTNAESSYDVNQTSIEDYSTMGSARPGLITLDLFSYAGSTNKTCLITRAYNQNLNPGSVWTTVALYRSTSAITSIVAIHNAQFASGTTATLYGILKA